MATSIVPANSPLSPEFYKMDNPNLGIALIFCNTDEKDDEDLRVALNKNKTRLESILDKFGFEVRIFDNFDYAQIEDALEKVSKEDHSQNDCLMTVFTSGEHNVINYEKLFAHDDLFRPFTKDSCTLKNKPKLCFIDVPRGNKGDFGAQYATDAQPFYEEKNVQEEEIVQEERDVQEPKEYFIPQTADLFIHFSTYKGYVNFQNTKMGSWFIQSLSSVLEKYFQEIKDKERENKYFDIYELATAVNRHVAYSYQSEHNKKSLSELKMMPMYTSSLTKLFRVMVKPKTKSKKFYHKIFSKIKKLNKKY